MIILLELINPQNIFSIIFEEIEVLKITDVYINIYRYVFFHYYNTA